MIKRLQIIIFFGLCSCSVGEKYSPPTYLTDQQLLKEINLKPTKKEIDKDWYTVFNDISLNTLLKHALNHNFTLQQGIENLKQSRLLLKIQSKQFFPMFDGEASYDYSKAHNSQLLMKDANDFTVGFDVGWEIDIWGKGKYITEQYFHLMQKAKFSLDNLRVTLGSEVVSNFIKLREAQQKLSIARKNLKLQKDILQIVQNKYDGGIADLLSLNQAQYAVEQTSSTIPLLKEQVESYKNALALLSGSLPKEIPVDLDNYKINLVSNTFKYSVKVLYELPLDVIHTRPDIMVAEEDLQSQHAALNQAISSLYPSINLQASFNYISSAGHHLFNSGNQVYGYTPGLTVPIWRWGQLVNNVEMQRRLKEETLLAYNEAVLCALTEIKNSLVAIELSYKTIAYKRNSYLKMQNIMNLTLDKYKNGLINFTDVAAAEQNLLESELALIESNAQILQNFVSFYKATGGGYNFKTYK